MSKYTMLLFCIISISILSCKNHSNSESSSLSGTGKNAYVLKFMPDSGIKYHYDISRSTEYKLKINDKKVDKQSRLKAGIDYNIGIDSSGDFILTIQYDRISIYTKYKDKETDESTTQPVNNFDPVSRMLHALRGANISVTVTPTGIVKSITGYKEIERSILSNMNIPNATAQRVVKQKIDQLIGENLIKRNVKQLFKFIPDSAVYVGSHWDVASNRTRGITMNIKTSYTLQSVENGQANITSKSEIASKNLAVNFLGTQVTTNLKGSQKGKYVIERRTGMLMKGEASSDIKGTLQMIGRKVPIQIESDISIQGKKRL